MPIDKDELIEKLQKELADFKDETEAFKYEAKPIMERAGLEIEMLRQRVNFLSARTQMFDDMMSLVRMHPGGNGAAMNGSMDISYQLKKFIDSEF